MRLAARFLLTILIAVVIYWGGQSMMVQAVSSMGDGTDHGLVFDANR